MVTAAWDTSNLVALYKDGKQCTSCCFEGYEPGSCCPGFGENSTPSQYTVVITGIEDCPGFPSDAEAVNGEWILDLIECEPLPWPEEPGCTWQYIDAGNVWIALVRNHTISCAEITVSAFVWYDGSWRGVFQQLNGYTYTTGWCDVLIQTGICSSSRQGINGTVKFWPLAWPQWVTTTTYFVGDRVYNDGEIYECTVSHVAAASNEPGTGGDWVTYWNTGDPCGDANVSCP